MLKRTETKSTRSTKWISNLGEGEIEGVGTEDPQRVGTQNFAGTMGKPAPFC